MFANCTVGSASVLMVYETICWLPMVNAMKERMLTNRRRMGMLRLILSVMDVPFLFPSAQPPKRLGGEDGEKKNLSTVIILKNAPVRKPRENCEFVENFKRQKPWCFAF